MEQKKLFLLDAYALIFRAYYAFIRAQIINSKGFGRTHGTGTEDILHGTWFTKEGEHQGPSTTE